MAVRASDDRALSHSGGRARARDRAIVERSTRPICGRLRGIVWHAGSESGGPAEIGAGIRYRCRATCSHVDAGRATLISSRPADTLGAHLSERSLLRPPLPATRRDATETHAILCTVTYEYLIRKRVSIVIGDRSLLAIDLSILLITLYPITCVATRPTNL